MAEKYIPQVGDKLNKYYFVFGETPEYKKTTLEITKITGKPIDGAYTIHYMEDTGKEKPERRQYCVGPKADAVLDGAIIVSGYGISVICVKGNKAKAKRLVQGYLDERWNAAVREVNRIEGKLGVLKTL